MKRMRKILPALAAGMIGTLAFSIPLFAEGIRVTQVDVNNLLVKGEVDLYVSLGDADSGAYAPASFAVTEADGTELEVRSVDRNANRDEGIAFLLLIDNSGSMYDETFQGTPRIDHAKLALGDFVSRVSGSKDTMGVMAFNTMLAELAPMGSDPGEIDRSIQALSRPDTDMAYTELYRSLDASMLKFARVPGRKALIVLSDGENFPFFATTGKPHPVWGEETVTPDDVLDRLWESGITLYGINFADKKDPDLARVAKASGGLIFDARDAGELGNVYAEIRERIQNEIRLRVKAPPYASSDRTVTVTVNGRSDSRNYMVPLLFGAPGPGSLLVSLLFVAFGLALVAFLFLVTFERPVESPQIQTLDSGMTIALQGTATVIGSSDRAQMTIAGNPAVDAEHATIFRDDDSGAFTLISKRRVRVNNNPVTKRTLTPGDVIQIEGTTIVFDAPETTKLTQPAKKHAK